MTQFRTVVYHPCSVCAGRGRVPTYDDEGHRDGVKECEYCAGEGKGTIKEIHETHEMEG